MIEKTAVTWVLATANPGKLRELSDLLKSLQVQIKSRSEWTDEDVPETGLTFVENALIKAQHAARVAGLPAIADDSGIAIDALNGAPGVYSARFAEKLTDDESQDDANNRLLLEKLKNQQDRRAHFYCCMVFIKHECDPAPLIATGRWDGEIIKHPRGEHGFGYDPLFKPAGFDCTSAELPKEQKNQISHRALAARELLAQLSASS